MCSFHNFTLVSNQVGEFNQLIRTELIRRCVLALYSVSSARTIAFSFGFKDGRGGEAMAAGQSANEWMRTLWLLCFSIGSSMSRTLQPISSYQIAKCEEIVNDFGYICVCVCINLLVRLQTHGNCIWMCVRAYAKIYACVCAGYSIFLRSLPHAASHFDTTVLIECNFFFLVVHVIHQKHITNTIKRI